MDRSQMMEEVVGTVIHGTLLPADLLQAFVEQLEVMDGQRASEIRKEHANVFESLPQLADADMEEKEGQRLIMDAGECFDTLIDALNACAPEGLFFGSHPGDGSDFGFWPIQSHERALGEEDGAAHSCPRCGEPMPWDCDVCGCNEQDEEEGE